MACSTCLLEQGHVPNCEFKNAGGNGRKLYIIPSCQITAVDDYASGIISGITLDAGGAWYEVEARKDTVQANWQYEPTNEVLNQQVLFTISSLGDGISKEEAAQAAIDFVADIVNSAENFSVLVQDRVGNWYLYGRSNGLEREDIQFTSGAAAADLNGTAITLTGSAEGPASVVDSAVVAAIAAA